MECVFNSAAESLKNKNKKNKKGSKEEERTAEEEEEMKRQRVRCFYHVTSVGLWVTSHG